MKRYLALALLPAFLTCNSQGGTFSSIPWSTDADLSFISPLNTYTAKVDVAATGSYGFSSGTGLTVNGVTFDQITIGTGFQGGLGAVSGTGFMFTPLASQYSGDLAANVAPPTGTASNVLRNGLLFDGNVTYTLTGLTPGSTYAFYFFSPKWDTTYGTRDGTLGSGSDSFPVDQAGGGTNQIIRYEYVATGSSQIIDLTNINGTLHQYGFLNVLVPPVSDSDGDGLLDAWELAYAPNLTDLTGLIAGAGPGAGTGNFDGDGLTDLEEFTLSQSTYPLINPTLADTDSDSLTDGSEINGAGLRPPTNPTSDDTDGDGLSDTVETNTLTFGSASDTGSDPTDTDTDDDTYGDSAEVTAGSDPNSGSSNPFNLPGVVTLIDPITRNGSFEGTSGLWGPVEFWDDWTGVSAANNDSGVGADGSATEGFKIAYLQHNNAAYNLATTHIVAEGDVIRFRWDHAVGNASHTVSLVWNNGGTITPIAATEITSTAPGNGKGGAYTVLAGDPVIGSNIGVGIRNNNSNYPVVDNFVLVVYPSSPGDSDSDDLPDAWEQNFAGNLTDLNGLLSGSGPGANTGNFDGDGLTDLAEYNLSQGFYPTINPVLADTDSDELPDGSEIAGAGSRPPTNPTESDTDNDGVSDNAESNTETYVSNSDTGTDPTQFDTDGDQYGDGLELESGSSPLEPLSTPFNVPGAVSLIDTTTNNGSFETAIGLWNAVDFWDEWTGVSTATGDSGVGDSVSASNGVRVGFLQPGNAAYNMTTRVIAAGDVYRFGWDHVARNSSHTVSLVWNNGGTITSIAASAVTSTTVGNRKGLTYEVLPGDPAIGSPIGLGITNNNSNYPEVDNFLLVVFPASNDSDNDGLDDTWETTYFTGLGEDGDGDFEQDGTDNLTEFRLGLIPNSGSSRFAATLGSAGLIQWPSVTGVTFKIERSTTLAADSWTVLEAAFPGTAGTASYTDPSPPAGKAFYRIGLNP